jgi:chemotaxis protein MotB
MNHWNRTMIAALGLMCALPLLGGCASQKKLKDYESEVSSLREERTKLKKENQNLRSQIDGYEVALSEASMKTPPTDVKDYPGLDAQNVGYELRDGNMVITIPSEISFASGKAELSKSGKSALQEVARTLKSDYGGDDLVYWIEGHTDTDPIRKSGFGSNRELSVARSLAVLKFLVDECGIQDDHVVLAGHGQYSPVAENDSKTGKARNRRVEIIVRKK